MCGINLELTDGTVPIEKSRFLRARSLLAHRGPDASLEKFFWGDSLALGFNRLSIIDLSSQSMQPLSIDGDSLSLIFNGEIYNYMELRLELQKVGHVFFSKGDAEVILRAFLEWGVDCFEKFNGMWAVAIVDHKKRKITLCRDRFGVKPLYYMKAGNSVIVASELKAFAVYKQFDFQLNSEFLTSGHLNPQNSSYTIFENIRRVLPGHYIEIEQDEMRMTQKKWWITKTEKLPTGTSYEDLKNLLAYTIKDSINLRLRSDVPIAISLSSGIDSTLVAMFASELTNGEIVAYCQGNDENPEIDEFQYAYQTAKILGIRLRKTNIPLPLSSSLLLQSIMSLDGSSFFGPGIYSHYQQIHDDGFKVVLEGHGGDELFGGYSSYYQEAAAHFLTRGALNQWAKSKNMYLQMSGSALEKNEFPTILEAFHKELYGEIRNKVSRSIRNSLKTYSSASKTALDFEYLSRSAEIKSSMRSLDFLNKILYREFHFGTLAPILENFDKLSMSNSLEVRSPILDWRTVELSFSIPGNLKLSNTFSKKILRDLLRKDLPSSVTHRRRKLGFTGYERWFANEEIRQLILDTVHSDYFLSERAWNGVAIRDEVTKALLDNNYAQIMRHWGLIQVAIFVNQLKSITANS